MNEKFEKLHKGFLKYTAVMLQTIIQTTGQTFSALFMHTIHISLNQII